MRPVIEITVDGGDWPQEPILEQWVERAFAAAVAAEDLHCPQGAELSLLFTDNERMRELNRDWRNQDKPTNVLSFPGQDMAPGDEPGMMLGDIVLAASVVRAEADLEGKRFEDHLTHLIIHGILHLYGYDHLDEAQAQQMEDAERRALARLGIADPYADGVAA